jgi:hypothetical protein
LKDQTRAYVTREEFLALCKQVARLAGELEARERWEDPDGPNGWRLRTTTEIKRRVAKIGATSIELNTTPVEPLHQHGDKNV